MQGGVYRVVVELSMTKLTTYLLGPECTSEVVQLAKTSSTSSLYVFHQTEY